jgi:heme-degrading monooxygenase HmoA
MIVREWRGKTRAEDRPAYLQYLEATGLREYVATPGNRGVLALTRDADGETEFLLLSFWNSRADIAAFAGTDIDRAVFYPEDDRFLTARDLHVTHYEVAFESGPVDTRQP